MLLVVSALLTLLFFFILSTVLPADRFRGTVVAAVILGTSLGSTPVAPTSVREAVLWSSIAGLALAIIGPRPWPKSESPIPAVSILFFGVTALSTGAFHSAGIPALLRLALLATMLGIVATQFSRRDRAIALSGLLLAALIQSFLGIIEFVFQLPPLLWGYGQRADGSEALYYSTILEGHVRVQGSYGHPIPYATIIVLGIVVLVAQRNKRSRFIFVLLLSALGAGLLFSGTRSALLALTIALCYLLLVSTSSTHRVRNYMLAAAVLIGTFIYASEVRALVADLVQSGSFTNRLGAIESVPGLFGRQPLEVILGTGWGSEPSLFAAGYLQQNDFGVVDNQFVSTFATQGLIGFALFSLLFIISWRRGDAEQRALLLIVLVMAFSFDFVRWPSVLVLAFLAISMPAFRDNEVEGSNPLLEPRTYAK